MEQRRIERKMKEDLQAASGLDISSIRTLCLALGPYRSFTTITASIIARHPECQAINHGGRLILGDPHLDFISRYRSRAADRFLRYGLHISLNNAHSRHHRPGKRRNSPPTPRPAGDQPRPQPHAFFWNDPLRASHHLRRHNVEIAKLLEKEPRLRFLQTVRNPVDCAYSIGRNGLAPKFGLNHNAPVEEILDKVLDEIRWFMHYNHEHPGRFFVLFTDSFDSRKAHELARFLQVAPLDHWAEQNSMRFDYPRTVTVAGKLLKHYNRSVSSRFEEFPETRDRLLALLNS
jgi:hypothetical protein